jgi:endoglucanase
MTASIVRHPWCATAALCVAGAAQAATGYVRVDQIGYEAGLPMRAYLMSASPLRGETFKVETAAGRVAAAGTVGGKLGDWASYSVYPIDFTLSVPGRYAIRVGGAVGAASPVFPVAAPAALYGAPLAKTLLFYRNERDGPDYIASPLRRAPGHLNDASATVYRTPAFDGDDRIIGRLAPTGGKIDASGGWWDAGDYLKFVETASYTVALMAVGIRDFPKEMGAGSAVSDFTAEARFGLDWLLRMWDQPSRTLAYQVGIGSAFATSDDVSDHDLWRLPQADDTYAGRDPIYEYIRHRPVFRAGAAGSRLSPNLAGRLAADFALCFQIFRATDPSYAGRCLAAAETIFDLADTAPAGRLLTAAPWDFYHETEWRDDLELGAVELYFALKADGLPRGLPHKDPGYYLARAADWAYAYINGPNDQSDTLNLYDVSGLAHFELYRAIALARKPPLTVSQADLLADLAAQIAASVAAAQDPFGAGYNWSYGDTTSHLAGLSVMAKEYAWLTGDPRYETLSRRWLANVFGANAWGTSLIIGVGSTFPDCPHHQVANILGSLTGGAPVLAGAVVDGPNSATSSVWLSGMRACPPGGGDRFRPFNGRDAVYNDNVQSYTTVEPAIDLTATSMLMYSWRIAGAPSAARLGPTGRWRPSIRPTSPSDFAVRSTIQPGATKSVCGVTPKPGTC